MDKSEVTSGIIGIFSRNPWIIAIIVGILLVAIAVVATVFVVRAKRIKVGDFQVDLTKPESVKGNTGPNAKEINEIKRNIEESTRHVITRQFNLIHPFLQSLRPILNRLMYSILDEAVKSELGVEPERREVLDREPIDSGDEGSYYLIEKVKTYKHDSKTRVFTNLVESSVDSMLSDLEIELYKMLVSNNIGKSKEEVQAYVKSRSEFIIGIIRNNLCDSYNQLSNNNLFDTKRFWAETGITYPEDWISDQIYKLLKNCMEVRYSDFEG